MIIAKDTQEFYNSLDEQQKIKIDALKQASEILVKAQIPFWLFADRPNDKGQDAYYVYGWNQQGEDSEANYYGGLAWTVAEIFKATAAENGLKGDFDWLRIMAGADEKYRKYLDACMD